MPHYTPLIGTIAAALVAAFIMGAIAQRLKISPIAGYLLAGVLVGPFTPGFVADAEMAHELAEMGVILLMFGVGLHFSFSDLHSVRKIAVPGALVQIATATALGFGLAMLLGWGPLAGLVFGLSLSVASTVVLLRALESRNLVETERGRIAVGWLVVEDIAIILALVLLPAVAGAVGDADGGLSALAAAGGMMLLKLAGFFALILLVGRRVIPWALHWVVHTGSRELFRLSVLAIAVGVAFGAAMIFGVSFALGAFFAGVILSETPLSRRAAEETLPLRDAFAVLFFVAVGMLFDPAVIIEQPLSLIATVFIIIVGKSLAAFAIVRTFGHDNRTATTVSASLAQIGEFSFILAGLGLSLAILPREAHDLILASAIVSILLHPVVFSMAVRRTQAVPAAPREPPKAQGHIILVGWGRVGKLITQLLKQAGREFVIVEYQYDVAAKAREQGLNVIRGNAASAEVLDEARIAEASHLLVAIPEGFEAGGVTEAASKLNPKLTIVARAHSDAEVDHLSRHGAGHVVLGEREIAKQMLLLARG